MKTLCVLPPPGPCFCACPSKFASVARGYLLSNLRILRTFLQVCTQHAYRPIHVVFAIYSRARAIVFVLGLMCWEAIGACVHRASLHSVCYGATVHTGHRYRCEYCAHGDGWGGGSCDVSLPTNYKLQNWIFKIHIMQDVSLVILYL